MAVGSGKEEAGASASMTARRPQASSGAGDLDALALGYQAARRRRRQSHGGDAGGLETTTDRRILGDVDEGFHPDDSSRDGVPGRWSLRTASSGGHKRIRWCVA